jgi:carbon-monoxide dehydrogenase small subunit
MSTHEITLTVNGDEQTLAVESRTLLVHALRDELGYTGPNVGCESSMCGACTIEVDGDVVKSCTMLAVQADGAEITTIEGLAESHGDLHPLQETFNEEHGLQCGYCTPGMIMTAKEFLEETQDPNPDDEEIRKAIKGNLCRCTGYQNIVRAVESAAEQMYGEEAESATDGGVQAEDAESLTDGGVPAEAAESGACDCASTDQNGGD